MKKLFAIALAALMALSLAAWAEEADAPTDAPAEAVEPAETVEAGDDATVPLELPDPEEVEALTTEEPAPEPMRIWFEEGFGLSLPEGWVSYTVADADRAAGLKYILGDGSGERLLYIQITPTRIADAEALGQVVEDAEEYAKTGALAFGGQDFVTFIDSAQNASCCATLLGDSLAVFMFTPQTDADFMLTATQVMETYSTL